MEVIVHPGGATGSPAHGVVAKVSPTGKLVTLADGSKFMGDGYEYGAFSANYRKRIEPATDEVRARVAANQGQERERLECRRLRFQIESGLHRLHGLSSTELQSIVDIIWGHDKAD